MKDFKDKVALITGAANGFGREFLKEASRRGMRIAALDIEKEEVEAAAEEARALGAAEIFTIQADVTRVEDCERAVDEVMEK